MPNKHIDDGRGVRPIYSPPRPSAMTSSLPSNTIRFRIKILTYRLTEVHAYDGVSSKGQSVIPKEVRGSLQWGIGIELILVTTELRILPLALALGVPRPT